MDKYQLIDSIILQIDAMVEAKGIEKCKIAIELIQKLGALKDGLKSDDADAKERCDRMQKRIDELTELETIHCDVEVK